MMSTKTGRFALATVVLWIGFGMAGQARADLTFNFSITSDTSLFPGYTLPGTVTGQIVLQSDNTVNEAATNVYLTSYPSGITTSEPLPPDATTWNYSGLANSFTVQGGAITAASFYAYDVTPNGDEAFLALNNYGYNFYGTVNAFTGTTAYAGNADGPSGITFAPATLGTPEPSTFFIALLGAFGGLAYGAARKRRAARIQRIEA
jgi:hypothetical protein